MAWSTRLPRPPTVTLPRTPASWLAAAAAGLALVSMVSPHVFPADARTAAAVSASTGSPAAGAPRGAAPSVATSAPAAATTAPAKSASPLLPTGPQLTANVRAAAAYAGDHGWQTGIAVVDTTTGEATTAGNIHGGFPAESTVKLLIAARLLAADKMSGDTEAKARAMITRSDDSAADELYLATGGDDLVSWAADRYRLDELGSAPTGGDLYWGSTQIAPLGMARFLAAAKADAKVGPWLLRTMAATEDKAADDTDQLFGLLAVDRHAPVKQGWGGDVSGGDGITAPSVGFVDNGRYAVAIYTLHTPAVPLADAQAMTTAQARILFGQKVAG